MRYKTAFRLALKAFGVLLLADAIPVLLSSVTQYLIDRWSVAAPALRGTVMLSWNWLMPSVVAGVAKAAIGLYLFLGARWIVNLAVPSNRPYCQECGYELTGLPTDGACPECGTSCARPPPER